ncbi:MAG: DNA polymerase Y family protein, partial [Pseudomonadales bacterium]|nr:DNA polymerase Y family protein [Pseudomonadales bacterium]
YRFTPMLALQTPDRLLLEISASLRLFGGLAQLLEQVETGLAERCYTHLGGLAPTPRGAQLMTRTLPCTATALPEWCINNDLKHFRTLIDTLPLALLDVAEKQLQVMRRMGFTRIGELLALPRAALGKRFGQELLTCLRQLCGEQADPRVPHRPRDFFHAELHFLEPLHDRTMLLFPMQRLLRELSQFLERRQCHCQRLEWRMRSACGQSHRLAVPCSLAYHSDTALLDLTRLALESLQLPEPVESLSLGCRAFSPVHQQSAALFHGATADLAQAEKLLLDRLAIRIGEQCLHGIRLADAHLPEEAWQRSHDDTPDSDTPAPAQRPCWLLPQPVALQQHTTGPTWNGHLQLLNGPERIESNWWGTAVKRDYFIARHENGSLCWVFREYGSRQWFLHGLFG